ncbi:acyl-CoA thioesterase [Actinopolymorpha alba]|uniref:acyl-CoA thioesterase n=1 Tax=Actinopolymorpha alba TaxID=533267 RepID=UPI0003655830|nr:thioesterase family protein [Actinopolymorpha alba]
MAHFVFPCPLRWSDMDTYGHVNNVVYLRYLEEARVAMFFNGAREAGVKSFEGELVVVRHEIDYRRPLVFRPEPVLIETWVTDIRSSSFGLRYEVRDEETTFARASSVLAAYDADLGHARRLTQEERAWLERFRSE